MVATVLRRTVLGRTVLGAVLLLSSALRADHPGTHGMLVVGEASVYLSHLPLFHAPHDYQILVEARFTGGTGADPQALYLEDRKRTGTAIYTIEPEPFVLPDRIRSMKPFKATLYRGHFERGGEPIARDVTVEIVRVIHLRKFAATAAKPTAMEYLAFGGGDDVYLAHRLVGPPDVDQIVKITATPPFGGGELSRGVVTRLGTLEPLQDGQEVDGVVAKGPTRRIRVAKVLYTEKDELK